MSLHPDLTWRRVREDQRQGPQMCPRCGRHSRTCASFVGHVTTHTAVPLPGPRDTYVAIGLLDRPHARTHWWVYRTSGPDCTERVMERPRRALRPERPGADEHPRRTSQDERRAA